MYAVGHDTDVNVSNDQKNRERIAHHRVFLLSSNIVIFTIMFGVLLQRCLHSSRPYSTIGKRRFSVPAQIFKSSRFLPFEEARDYVRALGLRSAKEWREWCRFPTSRPPMIPAGADCAYKDQGWSGWEDFLGYEKTVPKSWGEVPGPRHSPQLIRRETTRDAGYCLLFQFIDGNSLQFEKTWRRSSVQFLYRASRERDREDAWAPLFVRCRDELAGGGFRVRMPLGDQVDCGALLVSVKEAKIMFIPRGDFAALVARQREKLGDPCGLLDRTLYISREGVEKYTVPDAVTFHALLEAEYDQCLNKLPYLDLDAQNQYVNSDGDQLFAGMLEQLDRKIYSQVESGMRLRFPTTSCAGRAYNSLLGSWRVWHRALVRVSGVERESSRVKLTIEHRNRGRGISTPVALSNAPDFVVALDKCPHDRDRLVGVFILPRKFLEAEGIFAGERSKGKCAIYFYPPRVEPKRTPTLKTQSAQREYYIDLSYDEDDPHLQMEIEKAKRILKFN